LSCPNITRLTSFHPGAKQHYDHRARAPEVNAVARSEIDSQFVNAPANRTTVSEVSQTDPVEARPDNPGSPQILQFRQSLRKWRRITFTIKQNFDFGVHDLV